MTEQGTKLIREFTPEKGKRYLALFIEACKMGVRLIAASAEHTKETDHAGQASTATGD